jgi:hypothetical protein
VQITSCALFATAYMLNPSLNYVPAETWSS